MLTSVIMQMTLVCGRSLAGDQTHLASVVVRLRAPFRGRVIQGACGGTFRAPREACAERLPVEAGPLALAHGWSLSRPEPVPPDGGVSLGPGRAFALRGFLAGAAGSHSRPQGAHRSLPVTWSRGPGGACGPAVHLCALSD